MKDQLCRKIYIPTSKASLIALDTSFRVSVGDAAGAQTGPLDRERHGLERGIAIDQIYPLEGDVEAVPFSH